MRKYFNPYCLVIFLTFLIATNICYPQSLFKIYEQGKIGFIDSTGRVVIKPKFATTGEFSEGLAPARLNGYYGFIDTTGNYVIQPQFEFATEFHEGFAIAYVNSMPFYINKSGEKLFDFEVIALANFKNGRALIRTFSRKFGVIDTNGKMILDTNYGFIYHYYDEQMVVREVGYSELNKMTGVVDRDGNFIVPFGLYYDIDTYHEGFAAVTIQSHYILHFGRKSDGFINRNGELIYRTEDSSFHYLDQFHNGAIKIYLLKNWITRNNFDSIENRFNTGFLDTNGHLIFSDSNYNCDYISNNRIFLKSVESNSGYSLYDLSGNKINNVEFKYIQSYHYEGGAFINGYSVVADSLGSNIIIDTSGNIILNSGPEIKTMYCFELFKLGYLQYNFKNPKSDDEKGFGLMKINGEILTGPNFNFIDYNYKNGLLKVITRDSLKGYLDYNGEFVWKENKLNYDDSDTLDIDFMMNFCYKFYRNERTYNLDKKINIDELNNDGKTNKMNLSLFLDINDKDKFKEKYAGYKLFVINSKKDTIKTYTETGIRLVLQALNENNEWKDIQYTSYNMCEDNYDFIIFPPLSYRAFSVPCFKGGFMTKIRAKLTYRDYSNFWEPIEIYSNTIEGSVNPGQFWRTWDLEFRYLNDFPYGYHSDYFLSEIYE